MAFADAATALELGKKGTYKYAAVPCVDCGELHWVALKCGKPRSTRCYSCSNKIGRSRRLEENGNWSGGRHRQNDGYIFRTLYPNHPFWNMADKMGRVREHRLVMAESLNRAIEMIKPGIRLGEVSNLIQNIIEAKGLSVIKELTGHGIGRGLHEDPHIFNYGNPKSGPILKAGMVLAIEPMASLGSDKIKEGSDRYAYITKDSSLSCHFEHTIAITKNGSEVLTKTLNS